MTFVDATSCKIEAFPAFMSHEALIRLVPYATTYIFFIQKILISSHILFLHIKFSGLFRRSPHFK